MKSFLSFITAITAVLLMTTAAPAFAEMDALNRDALPTVPRVLSKKEKEDMKKWLEKNNVNTEDDSVTSNLLNLGMGVNYPVSDDVDFIVSCRSKLRFGVSF